MIIRRNSKSIAIFPYLPLRVSDALFFDPATMRETTRWSDPFQGEPYALNSAELLGILETVNRIVLRYGVNYYASKQQISSAIARQLRLLTEGGPK